MVHGTGVKAGRLRHRVRRSHRMRRDLSDVVAKSILRCWSGDLMGIREEIIPDQRYCAIARWAAET